MSSDAPAGEGEAVDRRLALLDELRQSERRAAISQVARVIGHLIGTPLNVIAGRAALIRANPTPESVGANARRIEEQVERLAKRIRRLIDYLTLPEPRPEPRAADAVVREALALYGPIAIERGVGIHVTSETVPSLSIEGTSALVVLTSLLSLALRIAPRGETVELSVEPSAANGVLFELRVPRLEVPRAGLERLDPPDDEDGESAEQHQLLSVCYQMARRQGQGGQKSGRLEVVSLEGGRAAIRFECAAV
jgi:signal transduction histidine kinase